jgi:hypothetical protein
MNKIDPMVRTLLLAFPSLFKNRCDVMAELMTNSCYGWNKKGCLVQTVGDFADRPQTPEAMVAEYEKELAEAKAKYDPAKEAACLRELHERVVIEAEKELHDARFRAQHIDVFARDYTACGYEAAHAWLHHTDRYGVSEYWSINKLPKNLDPEWRKAIQDWLHYLMPSANSLFAINTTERYEAVPGYEEVFNWLRAKINELETEADRVAAKEMVALADEIVAELRREEAAGE